MGNVIAKSSYAAVEMRSSAPQTPPTITAPPPPPPSFSEKPKIYIDFGIVKGSPFNMTLELEGLQQDGTFAPGSNATWFREGRSPRYVTIERGNVKEGWVSFNYEGDIINFGCDQNNDCSAVVIDKNGALTWSKNATI